MVYKYIVYIEAENKCECDLDDDCDCDDLYLELMDKADAIMSETFAKLRELNPCITVTGEKDVSVFPGLKDLY